MYSRPAEFDKTKIWGFGMLLEVSNTDECSRDDAEPPRLLYLTRYTHKDSSFLRNSDSFENADPSSY
jgi:hypothetical protein